jgi:hypothetical protein
MGPLPARRPHGLETLRNLREALRAELLARTGEGNPAHTWPPLATLVTGAGVGLVLPQAGRAAGPAAVYDAVRGDCWRRLKACRKHTCLFAFYDRSKNGSGAWCKMAVCGNA